MLKKDELHVNRTFKYLYPCLIELGPAFIGKLNKFVKLGIFITDMNYYTLNTCLYLVINVSPYRAGYLLEEYRKEFQEFLYWFKMQDFYETDYCYQTNFHIIVVKLPEILSSSIDSFMSGEYSKIFTKEQINKYFKPISLIDPIMEEKRNKEIQDTKSILTKDKAYIETYAKRVNKEYQTNVSPKYFQNVELDKPPYLPNEILNY